MKKAPQRDGAAGVRAWPAAEDVTSPARENPLAFLLPCPLHGRNAWGWLRSVTVDFFLVTVSWLLIGASLVPLRLLFPQVWVFRFAAGSPISLVGVALLQASLITLISYVERSYSRNREPGFEARRLANSVIWSTALMATAYSLQGAPWARTGLFCVAGVFHFGVLWAWRWHARQTKSHGHDRSPGGSRNVLIVGAGPVGQSVAAHLRRGADDGRTVCGLLDNDPTSGEGVIGRVSDLPRLARRGFVDEVILAAPRDRTLTLQVLREARRMRLDVEIVPDLYGCRPTRTEFHTLGELPLISLHSEKAPAAKLAIKRLLDVGASCVGLIALLPVFAAIAALIKLDSPGPVFYAAQRAGRKARPFLCYKFRTMVANADDLKGVLRVSNQRSGPFFKIADDPRITRIGKFLRHYSLDELPQLWNVLKGEMSLVGPRPHPLDDFAAYETKHLARLDVTPGITGLWQVTARRDPSFQRGMELDREYIQTWTLRLDLEIMLKTVAAVVRGGGD